MPQRVALTVNIDVHGSEEFMRAAVQRVLDEKFPNLFPGVSLFTQPASPVSRGEDLLRFGAGRQKRRNWLHDDYYALPDLTKQHPETD